MKIYIVEDDKTLRTELCKLLNSYGYECAYSDDFQNIVQHIFNENPSLILLDINLPYYDGYQICREIRKKSDVPVIIVTSRSTDMDELMSLNLGADDFITKPYNSHILLAHISAVLKRGRNTVSDTAEYRGLELIFSKSTAEYKDKSIALTKNEFQILLFLIKNKEHIVSREDIMNELWQTDEFIDDNTLTVNINRLRKKLSSIGLDDFIITKRGQGYIV
ncbi:MAG: response regulator transcription factor [Clostridia bacterium]|nr:response regulator transcription factor [Clostridia bacterium]